MSFHPGEFFPLPLLWHVGAPCHTLLRPLVVLRCVRVRHLNAWLLVRACGKATAESPNACNHPWLLARAVREAQLALPRSVSPDTHTVTCPLGLGKYIPHLNDLHPPSIAGL